MQPFFVLTLYAQNDGFIYFCQLTELSEPANNGIISLQVYKEIDRRPLRNNSKLLFSSNSNGYW